jgi:threonine synthase
MKYVSTRTGSGPDAPAVGFLDAILSGLAPDGGLYVPEVWPELTHAEIAAFAGQPYHRVAAEVLSRFTGGEIPADVLDEMCEEAYSTFTHTATCPVKQLSPGLFMVELFHGPSLAFKDVAMQLLGRLYDYALSRHGRTMTVVCATSGDTGGAAVEAFRGRSNARIVALFPEGRISEVQRRFMTTAGESNVACVSVDGTFDDCQAIVKAMFGDDQFRNAVDLSGVNSINFARIAAQAVYYFTAAVALGAPHRPVAFAVPTGNFGDAFAGWVAKRMGLPIAHILVATNSNDIVAAPSRPAATRAAWSPRPSLRRWTSRSPPTSSGSITRASAATASRPAAPSGRSARPASSTCRPRPWPPCARPSPAPR